MPEIYDSHIRFLPLARFYGQMYFQLHESLPKEFSAVLSSPNIFLFAILCFFGHISDLLHIVE